MKIKAVALMIALMGLPTPENIGAQQSTAEKVYYGEVMKETPEAITLNVSPCEKEQRPQTISPYKKVGSEEVSCHNGRKYKYTRVAIQQLPESTNKKDDKRDKENNQEPNSDERNEKNKKAPQEPGEDTKDKPPV